MLLRTQHGNIADISHRWITDEELRSKLSTIVDFDHPEKDIEFLRDWIGIDEDVFKLKIAMVLRWIYSDIQSVDVLLTGIEEIPLAKQPEWAKDKLIEWIESNGYELDEYDHDGMPGGVMYELVLAS